MIQLKVLVCKWASRCLYESYQYYVTHLGTFPYEQLGVHQAIKKFLVFIESKVLRKTPTLSPIISTMEQVLISQPVFLTLFQYYPPCIVKHPESCFLTFYIEIIPFFTTRARVVTCLSMLSCMMLSIWYYLFKRKNYEIYNAIILGSYCLFGSRNSVDSVATR